MSGSKDYMFALEALRAQARRILCDAGQLEQCAIHGTYFRVNISSDLETAYRIANARITARKLDLGDWTRRDFTDAIKHEYEAHRALSDCPHCRHAMAA